MLQAFDTLSELTVAFPDEQTCIEHFRAIRWARGAFCPYCGCTEIYNFTDERTHKCKACDDVKISKKKKPPRKAAVRSRTAHIGSTLPKSP